MKANTILGTGRGSGDGGERPRRHSTWQRPHLQRPHLWRMLAPVALALALLLAGCGLTTTPGAGAGTPTATPTGTLDGKVEASPTCPVEPVAHPCSPAPVPHRPITIKTPDGKLVQTVTTDANGHFSATLPAGSYVLRVAIEPGTVGIRQITPGNVTITAGGTTTITIELDTGIR